MQRYLIACLGNPGNEYTATRHNIGFRVADVLAAEATFSNSRLAASVELTYRGRRLLIIKPTTYMNESGRAVAYYLTQHSFNLDQLLIVTDDIALPFGMLRLRPKGSDGGHNGLKNIIAVLGSDAFARLRLGVGHDFATGKQVDYVLASFTQQEEAKLPAVLAGAADAVRCMAFHGLAQAMNLYNRSMLATPN